MDFKTILFERKGTIAIVTMNQPENFNAINVELCTDLIQAIEICGEDESIRAVVLTGSGPFFCSGGDLNKVRESMGTPGQNRFLREGTKILHRIITDIRLIPKPVIASINGSLGGAGCSLALACDLRIAVNTAKFKQSYTSIGLSPDGGFTILAGAILGLGKASELLFLDPVLKAEQALAIGLLHKVVAADELTATTLQWAEQLAAGATKSFAVAKSLLNKALLPTLESHLELERQGIMASSLTKDYEEGITAFFEKRSPVFQGK